MIIFHLHKLTTRLFEKKMGDKTCNRCHAVYVFYIICSLQKPGLRKVASNNKKLTDDNCDALHDLLTRCEFLFGGTLGTRNKNTGRYKSTTRCQTIPRKYLPFTKSERSCLQKKV